MKAKTLISLISISFLSGCASSGYSITYNTEPTGASIVCNGISSGYSPVSLYYTLDENHKKYGSMDTVPCTAIWSSGVRKDFGNTWDLNAFPNGVMQTLQRPDAEGYAQDAAFALQVMQANAAERQADAAERQAESVSDPVTCYTTFGTTTCY